MRSSKRFASSLRQGGALRTTTGAAIRACPSCANQREARTRGLLTRLRASLHQEAGSGERERDAGEGGALPREAEGQAQEEEEESLWSQRSHLHVTPNFLRQDVASGLRGTFDQRFGDPRAATEERFVWDYWHVPDQYNLLRTPVSILSIPPPKHLDTLVLTQPLLLTPPASLRLCLFPHQGQNVFFGRCVRRARGRSPDVRPAEARVLRHNTHLAVLLH